MRPYHLSIVSLLSTLPLLLSNTAVGAFPSAAAATNPTPLAILNSRGGGSSNAASSSSRRSSLSSSSDRHLRTFARGGGPSILAGPIALRGGASAATAAASSTSLAAVPAWVQACGLAAPIASVFVSLSPLPTVNKIRKDKSVGDLPLLPYSSLVANCFIWLTYGLLKKEAKVWSCNAFSFILGLYYVASFTKYSPKSSPTLPGSVSQHLQASATAVLGALAVAATMSRTKAASILGSAGVAICIALFASPLAALKTVFETRSAESIPLPFALAATANCLLWSVVGVLDMKDLNIWLPNILGLGCGLIQIALKLWFGNGEKGVELASAKQAA